MIQQKLGSEWGVWCLYEGDKAVNQEVNYDKNLELVFSLESVSELAYVWNKTPFSTLENFLSNPKSGTVKKYIDRKGEGARKIESVCYFRKGITPTWEDSENKAGGQFTCFITREQIETIPVYQSFVFCLLGDLLPQAAQINGIRFVDKYNEKRGESNVKMEIWVRFKEN